MEQDEEQKIVVFGAGGVGKTSLTLRFVTGDFLVDHYQYFYEDDYRKQVEVDDLQCTVNIQDTAGNEEYSALRDMWVRESSSFVLVYAIDNHRSFDEIRNFLTRIERIKEDELDYVSIVLVGNKSDLEIRRQVSKSEGVDLAKTITDMGILTDFFETSAKDNVNVEQMFFECVRLKRRLDDDYWHRRNPKPLPEYNSCNCCLSGGVTLAYDILTILISIADISTDVWVCYHYHRRGRKAPFALALTILCAAQLSYVMAFVLRFAPYKTTPLTSVCAMICLLPVSPLLSFVMYFASIPGCFLYEIMKDMGLDMDDPTPRPNETKIERFVKAKLIKHMGFLLEATVEAFPQSILQMAVMVYFGETNWVSVVSILLSLTSVCSKSLVFSYALDLRTFVFNYVSLVTDFIAVFALIAWLFYNPNGGGLSRLARFYLWKVAVTTLPIVAIAGVGMVCAIFDDHIYKIKRDSKSYPKCRLLAIATMLFFLWVLGTVFGTLMAEICCCSGLAFCMFFLFSDRFRSHSGQGIFWGKVFEFINSGGNWKDKLLRTVLANESVLRMRKSYGTNDDKMKDFLRQSRQKTYANVTWNDLRQNTVYSQKGGSPLKRLRYEHSELWKHIKENTDYLLDCEAVKREWNAHENGPKEVVTDICIWPFLICTFYVAFPTYVVCRFVNFAFVWLMLACTQWAAIEPLQLGMAALLCALQLTWLIALVFVLRLHFATWHILTGHTYVTTSIQSEEDALRWWQKIRDLHEAHTVEPRRREAVVDVMGPDIGSIVLLYMPSLLFEMGEENVV